jgi:hypothetical protein
VRSPLGFPNPVNEVAARLVAGGVVVLATALLVTHQWWLLVPLAYGFWARVLTGPTLSPLGSLVTRVLVPLLGLPDRPVPGAPKRFAQGIGAAVTSLIALLHLVGADGPALALVGVLAVFATLESALGFCVGCRIFAALMRVGVIPDAVCRDCADISRRIAVSA